MDAVGNVSVPRRPVIPVSLRFGQQKNTGTSLADVYQKLPPTVQDWVSRMNRSARLAGRETLTLEFLPGALFESARTGIEVLRKKTQVGWRSLFAFQTAEEKAGRDTLDALFQLGHSVPSSEKLALAEAELERHQKLAEKAVFAKPSVMVSDEEALLPGDQELYKLLTDFIALPESQQSAAVFIADLMVKSRVPTASTRCQDVGLIMQSAKSNVQLKPEFPPPGTLRGNFPQPAPQGLPSSGVGGGKSLDPLQLLKATLDAHMALPATERVMTKEQFDFLDQKLTELKTRSNRDPEYHKMYQLLKTAIKDLAWQRTGKKQIDVAQVQKILDEDHFGLETVKERIVEYMAVVSRLQKLGAAPKGAILCLVGPPGVGKTSLGHSIAKAMGRKFVRISLGGVRDEGAIRGHNYTYSGSKQGKIIQAYIQAGANDPVFQLDEIDKLGVGAQGDPAAALLEVLDPAQNNTFEDHYLGMSYDLSNTFFIATANYPDQIPAPLMDRMEVIELGGYDAEEKLAIATRYLVKKAMKDHGIKPEDLPLSDDTLRALSQKYTREPGVRKLEQLIRRLIRKRVVQIEKGQQEIPKITPDKLPEWVGPPAYLPESLRPPASGRVNGLFWSMAGGGVLPILVTARPVDTQGEGQFHLANPTGNLEKVMQESIQTAFGYMDTHPQELGMAGMTKNKSYRVYIGTQEGSIPKDGPSAGAAFTTALVSALMNWPVRADVAMTGTISLHGDIGAIGGLKEKLAGAARIGIKTVLIPKENMDAQGNIIEPGKLVVLPEKVKNQLQIIPVGHITEVLKHALVPLQAATAQTEPVKTEPVKTEPEKARVNAAPEKSQATAPPQAKPSGEADKPADPAKPASDVKPQGGQEPDTKDSETKPEGQKEPPKFSSARHSSPKSSAKVVPLRRSSGTFIVTA